MKLIVKSNNDKKEYFLGSITYLGSDPDCQICLDGNNISSRHARIEEREGHFFIRDYRSLSGIYINREKIQECLITPGDVIHIGEFEIFVCNDTETSFSLQSKNIKWNASLENLASVARTLYPVLLLGASGTGKEVLAQAIHKSSARRGRPYISVNCSALNETLVESELFGHVKGSFTGAIADRKGAFETARGGTLFLDEVGDLPLSVQAKLLRALENSEIRPVGSDRIVSTDIRVIAATNINLQEKINQGLFREDLFYRLNVIQIKTPKLSERMEDFDELLMHFAKSMKVRFSFMAIQQLKTMDWPGNIRELRNFVARASAIYGRQEIGVEMIPSLRPESQVAKSSALNSASLGGLPIIKEVERQLIMQKLSLNRGNQKQTAAELGMPKSTLHDRLKYYGINAAEFKI